MNMDHRVYVYIGTEKRNWQIRQPPPSGGLSFVASSVVRKFFESSPTTKDDLRKTETHTIRSVDLLRASDEDLAAGRRLQKVFAPFEWKYQIARQPLEIADLYGKRRTGRNRTKQWNRFPERNALLII